MAIGSTILPSEKGREELLKDKESDKKTQTNNDTKKTDTVADKDKKPSTAEEKYQEFIDKYKNLKINRQKYNTVSIDDFLPSLDEMMKEDCSIDILKGIADEINDDDDTYLDSAYYCEEPFTKEPGFYENENVFVLTASHMYADQTMWALNCIDGDTLYFSANDLHSGGSFKYKDGKVYKDYASYVKSNFSKDGSSKLAVRLLGIDAPEIPHYGIVYIKNNYGIDEYKIKDLKRMKANGKTVEFLPFEINKNKSYNVNQWTVKDRDDNETIKVYKEGDALFEIITKDMYIPGSTTIEPARYGGPSKNGYDSYVIVTKNESSSNTVLDGYRAQQRLKNLISKIEEGNSVDNFVLVLDSSTQTATRTFPTYMLFQTLFKMPENIVNIVKTWNMAYDGSGIPESRLNYGPFGVDAYDRMLGSLYVRVKFETGETWVNVAKYVLTGTDFTVANPGDGKSSELSSDKRAAGIFNLNSYIQNSTRYVDNLDKKGIDSYNEKIKLHKEITGIDFDKVKDCTIMLGDFLCLIPPQNIRTVTSTDYLKMPVLRGKGTMQKNRGNREQLIEIDLFFYGEAGINGIPYEATLPSGIKKTYYMNGLRSLLAQFKLCPFLPIENTYINSTLGIEVVALVNLAMSTVDGFPHLLKATLTLREFNYSVYMPDLPIDYYINNKEYLDDIEQGKDQIFGKAIEWELFRFYYQRGIEHGQDILQYDFNSFGYADVIYSNKNVLQPSNLTTNYMELYVVDEEWLKAALQYKKAYDYSGQYIADLELNENDKQVLKDIASIHNNIIDIDQEIKDFNSLLIKYEAKYYHGEYIETIYDIFGAKPVNVANLTLSKPPSTYGEQGINILKDIIQNRMYKKIRRNPSVDHIYTNEKYLGNGSVQWELCIVTTAGATASDISKIKENIKTITGKNKAHECFVNNTIHVYINANFDNNNEYVQGSVSKTYDSEFQSIINQYYDPSTAKTTSKSDNSISSTWQYSEEDEKEFLKNIFSKDAKSYSKDSLPSPKNMKTVPAVVVNNNKPFFTDKDRKNTESFETYSKFDSLGRCKTAYANIGKDLMPTETRGEISNITPTGWVNNKYDFIEGGYIYNRCHLIGYQLTAENDNSRNLITGTRFLNINGMLPFENLVADYVSSTGNHVLYRVTPVYEGNNLLANGVVIEAESLEDNGNGVKFCVYSLNVQPGVEINYSTGENKPDGTIKGSITNNTDSSDSSNNSNVGDFNTFIDSEGNIIGANQEMLDYTQYKDPRYTKFLPYLLDENGNSKKLDIDLMSFNMSNTFTEIYLKSSDGYAPQYMGGSDIVIEAKFTMVEEEVVKDLNRLISLLNYYYKTYRRVMPCAPLKIKNNYLQTLGVNEVSLDSVQIDTIEGFPGAYEVVLRMTSLDRIMRLRESLRKLSSTSYTTNLTESNLVNMFAIQEELAKAEVYPDLDLPTLEELANAGWKYLKYVNDKRRFVDPDFYMVYSFKYTSQLIKEIVYNDVYKKYKNKDNINTNVFLEDDSKMQASAKYDSVLGSTIQNENDFADLYDEVMNDVNEQSKNETIKEKIGKIKFEEYSDLAKVTDSIMYVTTTGMFDGWTLREPNFNAVLADNITNTYVSKLDCSGIDNSTVEEEDKDNQIYQEIYDMRCKAIELIDNILAKPLDPIEQNQNSDNMVDNIIKAISQIIVKDKDGLELMKLLNGGNSISTKMYDITKEKQFVDQVIDLAAIIAKGIMSPLVLAKTVVDKFIEHKPDDDIYKQFDENYMLNFILLYMLACCYAINGDIDKKDSNDPYVLIKDTLVGNGQLLKLYDYNGDYDKLFEDVHKAQCGGRFGVYKISTYSSDKLMSITKPNEHIKYTKDDKDLNIMYPNSKDKFCEDNAFIDPYYNYAGQRSTKGKIYKENLIKDNTYNTMAFLRLVLQTLKRMIIEGYFFSEIDVMMKDTAKLKSTMKATFGKMFEDAVDNIKEEAGYYSFFGIELPISKMDFNDLLGIQDELSEIDDAVGGNASNIEALIDELNSTYKKICCSRLIYPFIATLVEYDNSIIKYFENRSYDLLSTFSNGISSSNEDNEYFNKFLSYLSKIGLFNYNETDINGTRNAVSTSQKANNLLMQEAFTDAANDPTKYVLHSFYDMCCNDKRGRLLRAFPTYYLVFIDEGRKIGTWKLYDNFYNMSSISELQIVKSRKIATDTCNFTMSNMYMSYAETYDNTIYQQYVDVYGMKDLFTSIFSPKSFANKEDLLRKRKQLRDTTVLSPGVRIHVRLGYGSNASDLPIVFNGKIAELDFGEVVQVICQGDGHELSNPLNALGEITAKNLDEAQDMVTLLKDVRGTIARGGESPKNLASKLLNAKYGGVIQTVLRELSNQRFYATNPFGIFHFGDRRFQDIFMEGETVQNIYEVTNKTLMSSFNTLMPDMADADTPTINCNLQDKTYWEILNMCANSGDGYYAAIRDFGFRSTVCLCKSNHYYAYDYRKVGNVIYEKRKPFQQYHYYDSYNDIIYNSIKASEKVMKTNAVGIWQSTDRLWGTSQNTVGPVFLDLNIYPEYQKSMTVDTGIIGGGNGGIELGIATHYGEQWNETVYDDKVNVSLVEKITTNVLRHSVKDMYEGELCVIGDPTVKPFDSMYFSDLYEDMMGTVEVETVIHNFNANTGFTTSIVPDLVTCTEGIEEKVYEESIYGDVAQKLTAGTVGLSSLIYSIKVGAVKNATGIKIPVFTFLKNLIQTGTSAISQQAVKTVFTRILSAATANPVGLIATIALAAGTYVLTKNLKDMFYRTFKNIQCITVFPIYKLQRPLIAGMAGHRGSVYGYPYPEGAREDSIQKMIIDISESSIGGAIFGTILSGNNNQVIFDNWRASLFMEGEANKENPFSDANSDEENKSIFINMMYGAISKELSSRNLQVQSLKTKMRLNLDINDSNNNISGYDEFIAYQIGGLHLNADDEEFEDIDKSEKKALDPEDIGSSDKINDLVIIEDDDYIKSAINGNHITIKEFTISHSISSTQEIELIKESGNRIVKAIVVDKGDYVIYDLPLIREDCMIVLKLLLMNNNLQNLRINFASGTRVNDTEGWNSTGFVFTLTCADNFDALVKATEETREQMKWYSSTEKKYLFSYGTDKNSSAVAILVYPPLKEE